VALALDRGHLLTLRETLIDLFELLGELRIEPLDHETHATGVFHTHHLGVYLGVYPEAHATGVFHTHDAAIGVVAGAMLAGAT
jgi:hypothetical protein